MVSRRIEVFFYGLFMDADLLRTKGANPVNIRLACALGFALRIGQRATLLRSPDARAYGILMELSHAEIDRLYSEASVRAYRPEAVLNFPTVHAFLHCASISSCHPVLKRPTQNTQRSCVISRADWDSPMIMLRLSNKFQGEYYRVPESYDDKEDVERTGGVAVDPDNPYAGDFGPFDGRVWLNTAQQGPLPKVAIEAAKVALRSEYARITPGIVWARLVTGHLSFPEEIFRHERAANEVVLSSFTQLLETLLPPTQGAEIRVQFKAGQEESSARI